jgi:hypothetical protein
MDGLINIINTYSEDLIKKNLSLEGMYVYKGILNTIYTMIIQNHENVSEEEIHLYEEFNNLYLNKCRLCIDNLSHTLPDIREDIAKLNSDVEEELPLYKYKMEDGKTYWFKHFDVSENTKSVSYKFKYHLYKQIEELEASDMSNEDKIEEAKSLTIQCINESSISDEKRSGYLKEIHKYKKLESFKSWINNIIKNGSEYYQPINFVPENPELYPEMK